MRYVILHHTGYREDHFDLMLEVDEAGLLQTWRLDAYPSPTKIERLPDHRRLYLDYEGPVSNNRGVVRRVAAGEYDVRREDEHTLRVALSGGATLDLTKG